MERFYFTEINKISKRPALSDCAYNYMHNLARTGLLLFSLKIVIILFLADEKGDRYNQG